MIRISLVSLILLWSLPGGGALAQTTLEEQCFATRTASDFTKSIRGHIERCWEATLRQGMYSVVVGKDYHGADISLEYCGCDYCTFEETRDCMVACSERDFQYGSAARFGGYDPQGLQRPGSRREISQELLEYLFTGPRSCTDAVRSALDMARDYGERVEPNNNPACRRLASQLFAEAWEAKTAMTRRLCQVAPPSNMSATARTLACRQDEVADGPYWQQSLEVGLLFDFDGSFELFVEALMYQIREYVIYDERGTQGYEFTRSLIVSGNAQAFYDNFILGQEGDFIRLQVYIIRQRDGEYRNFIHRIELAVSDAYESPDDGSVDEYFRQQIGALSTLYLTNFYNERAAAAGFLGTMADGSSLGTGFWPTLADSFEQFERDLVLLSRGRETRYRSRFGAPDPHGSDPLPIMAEAGYRAEQVWNNLPGDVREYYRNCDGGSDQNFELSRVVRSSIDNVWQQIRETHPGGDPGTIDAVRGR